MANSNLLTVKGLHTFNNDLSSVPEGSLKVAKNVNVDRTGVVEPRRGFKTWRTLTNNNHRVKALIPYKNSLIVHYADKLAYDNGTTLVNYPGTFNEVEANYRLQYVNQNGNIYFNTNDGIKKISTNSTLSSATISNAGGLRALAGEAIPDYASLGFLAPLSKVGYRITWCIKDVNNNLIEGAPSPLFECMNPSSSLSATVKVKFDPPPGATTQHFFRIYRTDVYTAASVTELATLEVADELKLVYEEMYDGTPGTIVVDDLATTFFRNNQLPLYTNAISGEGISQSNFAPPFSITLENYLGYTFYANTKLKHFRVIDVLGVSNFKSYGGSQVYDVDTNLQLIPLNPTISITSLSITPTSASITFSSLPSELGVGKYIVVYGSGVTGLDSNEHQITAVSGNTITVTGSFSGTPNASKTAVYTGFFQIKKGSNPASRYFAVGLKEIEEFTFTGYNNTNKSSQYPNTQIITMYSADNRIKYGIWFAHSSTDTPPSFNGVTVRVKLYASSMTAQQVAEEFKNAIENETLDLEAVRLSGASNDVVRVVRLISGPATNTSFSGPIPGITTHTIVQEGYGENSVKKHVLFPRALSAATSIDEYTKSLCRVINKNTAEYVNAFYIFDPGSNPGKVEFQSKIWDNEAIELDYYPIEFRENFNPNFPLLTENVQTKNRLYFSKLYQPEAVPIANYIDIGSSDYPIERIVALQDSLIIFKRDGIYRLSGSSPNSFFVTVLDRSAYIIARDAVTVLNNLIYAFTSQGVVQVSDTGIAIISRPIENLLLKYFSDDFTSLKHMLFMFSSEEDRALFFAVPENNTDTSATIIYRYNIFTQAWTTWTLPTICGISFNSRIYLGMGDIAGIDIERKDFSKYDYADRIYTKQFIFNSFISPNKFKLSSVSDTQIGDALYQKQAVTISKFNQLTAQLYSDPAIQALPPAQKSFYQTFKANIGDNISNKLQTLATTLNTHLGTSFTTTFSTNVNILYNQYNTFITQLNNAPELVLSSYQPLTSFTYYESPIIKIDSNNKIVTTIDKVPFLEGDVELHKAIRAEFEYNPLTFGDVSALKHIRYGSVLLANADLYLAEIGYASDLSPYFEFIKFSLEGDGSWGVFFYGNTAWGGFGTQIPFRCTIPRQKQRCRFIRPKFKHYVAFFKFLVLGVSFDLDGAGNNAYKAL
ncbi:MAG: hypothetical protein RML94_09860 [Bacteroidia bacterium]|nr:hypothetical protein [Bacteroidia bacterium]